MTWNVEPRCSTCSASWPEVTATDADHRLVFCGNCRTFTALQRRWYTFRFDRCATCDADLAHEKPADHRRFACPLCGVGTVEFHDHSQEFPSREPPLLRPGMMVEATLDNWAIRVPDLPAIPLDHLSNAPKLDEFKVHSLEVTQVPALEEDGRGFYFRYRDDDQGPPDAR